MKSAAIFVAMILILATTAFASTKTFTVAKDPTFTTKITQTPTKISSKAGTTAFKDQVRFTIPRYFNDPKKAAPSFGSKKVSETPPTPPKYLSGPSVNVAGTSKLAPVKPKYAPRSNLPTESSVKTLVSFGGKLSTNAAFTKIEGRW